MSSEQSVNDTTASPGDDAQVRSPSRSERVMAGSPRSWSSGPRRPFLDYDAEIRRVIYSTNAIESLHARMRRAARARGHFPNEQAALECLYMVVGSLDPTGRGRRRWLNRWRPALNALATTFEGRLHPAGQ